MTNTCWRSLHTTSPRTVGRWDLSFAIWVSHTPAAAPTTPLSGPRCRFSMSITRYGNARSWAKSMTAQALSRRNSTSGRTRWPECRNASNFPPTDRIRWSPTTGAPGSRWSCPRSYIAEYSMWAVRTTRPVSWWFRRPFRCCCRGSRGVPMWRWAFRLPVVAIPHWMTSSASSSTPWFCEWILRGIPPSPTCSPRSASAVSPPTNIRMCRSKSSSSGSTRLGR